MKKTLFILLLLPTFLFAQNTVNVNVGNYNSNTFTSTVVTEQQTFYHGEFYWNHGLNVTTGAFTSDASKDISDYMPILPNKSITISSSDSSNITIYGWTYDANYAPISEIRNNVLVSTQLQTYTFTTPSNAAYLCVYTKALSDSFNLILRIRSTNTITYPSPVLPEQFTGTQTQQIQQAEDFARFTSSPVVLAGVYYLDSAIIVASGSRTILTGKIIQNPNDFDNVFRNEAIANQNFIKNRGNRDISIIGIGMPIIQGPFRTTQVLSAQIWKSSIFMFANVNIFTISGFTFKALSASIMGPEQCRNGTISDMTLLDGQEFPNQGGIIVQRGCYNLQISNINGICFDDLISIQNLSDLSTTSNILGTVNNYLPYAYSHNLDVFGIKVSNINRAVTKQIRTGSGGQPYFGGLIRILAAGSSAYVHDITIDNVSGYQNILIQEFTNAYGSQKANQVYNLAISNTGKAPIYINKPISNSSFINIAKTDTSGTYVSCALMDSSSNIYRQYIGQAPYQIDTVYGGVEHKRTLN